MKKIRVQQALLFFGLLLTQNVLAMERTARILISNHCFEHVFTRLAQWWMCCKLEEKNSILIKASKNRVENLDKIKRIMQSGASAHCTDKSKRTPLHYAFFHDHLQIAAYLISQGALVDSADKEGITSLHIASLLENINALKLLLQSNALVDKADKDGTTALHIASHKGNLEALQLLLHYNASVDKADSDGATALHIAAQQGNFDLLRLLLDHKALVDSVDKKGTTPLHSASVREDIEALKLLLQHNAFIGMQNIDGKTPLHIAAESGSRNAVLCLICKSIFLPSWNYTKEQTIVSTSKEDSKQEEIFKIIKNLNNISRTNKENDAAFALHHLMEIMDESLLDVVADLLKLKYQREMIKTWHTRKNSKYIKALFEAHCMRHLRKLKEIIALKDIKGKSALDVATKREELHSELLNTPQILQEISTVKKFKVMTRPIRESMEKNLRERLGISYK